jgi:hypothetical protein
VKATDGAALWKNGVISATAADGTTEGAERPGDNDDKEGVVPRNGVPESEALELAPAALTAIPAMPAEGTDM